MGRGLLSIQGEILPLTCRPSGVWSQEARVVVKDTVVIRAGTEVICAGEMCLPAKKGSLDSADAVLEGEEKFLERSPLLVARLAVHISPDCGVPLRLSNTSETDVKLYRGTYIANVHAVDRQAFAVMGAEQHSDTPDNVDKAVAHLSEPERSKFKELLTEFSGMFTGLGKTNLVEHSIPTGSARPVTQPYRRTPAHLRDRVKAQIEGW